MDLVGRKVKGFEFDKDKHPGFATDMGNYIGVEGIIVSVSDDIIFVLFPDGVSWTYPLDEAEEHLITNLSQVPVIKDSVIIEVSDDGESWYKAEVLMQLPHGDYVTTDLIRWKLGREIQ